MEGMQRCCVVVRVFCGVKDGEQVLTALLMSCLTVKEATWLTKNQSS
jgi:hypothetical protein